MFDTIFVFAKSTPEIPLFIRRKRFVFNFAYQKFRFQISQEKNEAAIRF